MIVSKVLVIGSQAPPVTSITSDANGINFRKREKTQQIFAGKILKSGGIRPFLNMSKKVNKYGFYILDD